MFGGPPLFSENLEVFMHGMRRSTFNNWATNYCEMTFEARSQITLPKRVSVPTTWDQAGEPNHQGEFAAAVAAIHM